MGWLSMAIMTLAHLVQTSHNIYCTTVTYIVDETDAHGPSSLYKTATVSVHIQLSFEFCF